MSAPAARSVTVDAPAAATSPPSIVSGTSIVRSRPATVAEVEGRFRPRPRGAPPDTSSSTTQTAPATMPTRSLPNPFPDDRDQVRVRGAADLHLCPRPCRRRAASTRRPTSQSGAAPRGAERLVAQARSGREDELSRPRNPLPSPASSRRMTSTASRSRLSGRRGLHPELVEPGAARRARGTRARAEAASRAAIWPAISTGCSVYGLSAAGPRRTRSVAPRHQQQRVDRGLEEEVVVDGNRVEARTARRSARARTYSSGGLVRLEGDGDFRRPHHRR